MKDYSLGIYILIICLIFSSCTKDEEAPLIDFQGPTANTILFNTNTLDFIVTYSDNKELSELKVDVSYTNDLSNWSTTETVNTETKEIAYSYNLSSEEDGKLVVSIEATDKCGNKKTEIIEYEYLGTSPGSLELSLKLLYDGEPLVMFQDYEYPDGRTLAFTRFSFFTSNISLDNQLISPIEFHNLTNNNAVLEDAQNGLPYLIHNIPQGSYNNLNLSVGVPEDLNAMDPGEFPADHPLARAAEHWFSWRSYVFVKIEGNLDSNGDGTKDLPIALHLGADEAFRSFSFNSDIEIMSSQVTKQDLKIDLAYIFGDSMNLYDIDSIPQIHSLSQLDAVVELANNIEKTFK